MRVPLDHHKLAHVHAAWIAHPSYIIPAQVDEHNMLGPLFGISEKILLKRLVLVLRRPPAPRARYGPELDPVAFEPHHHLG
jgi:hypothetical protein